MKLALAVLLATGAVADAAPRRHIVYPPPQGASQTPYEANIFGPGRSGVAPSTRPPQERSIYVIPAPRGAGTGGVKD